MSFYYNVGCHSGQTGLWIPLPQPAPPKMPNEGEPCDGPDEKSTLLDSSFDVQAFISLTIHDKVDFNCVYI